MARQPRIDDPGSYHHVMNRGANRCDVFFDDRDRIEFGRLLGEIHDRFDVVCLAYCLMDNHYHLVLHCPSGNLSAAMKHVGGVYTQHTNDRLGRDGALFRGRFRSIPITSDGYLLCAVRYIHRNCLDLPGVATVDAYRWSSHRAYLGHRPPPDWLDIAEVLGHFADVERFAEFVNGESMFARTHRPGVADLRSLIELAIATHDESDTEVAPQWLDRTIRHLLHLEPPHPAFAELNSDLPELGSPAQRSALSRARRRFDERPEIGRMLDMVRRGFPSSAAA